MEFFDRNLGQVKRRTEERDMALSLYKASVGQA